MGGNDYKKNIVAAGDHSSVDPTKVTLPTHNSDSLRVGVDVTALSGSGCTVTVTINGVDQDGTEYLLLTKAITATGLVEMVVSPGVPTSAGVALQAPLPQKVTVACVGSGTRTTLAYAVSAEVSQD